MIDPEFNRKGSSFAGILLSLVGLWMTVLGLIYRIEAVEKEVAALKAELHAKAPAPCETGAGTTIERQQGATLSPDSQRK